MEISLGSTARVVVSGQLKSRSRYGIRADGSRGAVGPELDSAGVALYQFGATLTGGPAGWVEAAAVVIPEPLAMDLPQAGMLVELTGDLRLSIRGGDYGSTRATIVGISGVRALGSAIDALTAVGAPRRGGGE